MSGAFGWTLRLGRYRSGRGEALAGAVSARGRGALDGGAVDHGRAERRRGRGARAAGRRTAKVSEQAMATTTAGERSLSGHCVRPRAVGRAATLTIGSGRRRRRVLKRVPKEFSASDGRSQHRPQQRQQHPAARLRGLPDRPGRDRRGGRPRAGGRLPPHRHRGDVRQRGGRRRGRPRLRPGPRRGLRHEQAEQRLPRARRRARGVREHAGRRSASTTSTCS